MKHTPSGTPSGGKHKPNHDQPSGKVHGSPSKIGLVTALVGALAGGASIPACAPDNAAHVGAACKSAERNAPLTMGIGQYAMLAEGLNDGIAGVDVVLDLTINGLTPMLEAACQGNPRVVVKGTIVTVVGQQWHETFGSLNGGGQEVVINGRQPRIAIHLNRPASYVRDFVIQITDAAGKTVLMESRRQPDAAPL